MKVDDEKASDRCGGRRVAGSVELRTLVRVATALGAHVEVSIRPHRQAERQSRQQARPKAKKPMTARSLV